MTVEFAEGDRIGLIWSSIGRLDRAELPASLLRFTATVKAEDWIPF